MLLGSLVSEQFLFLLCDLTETFGQQLQFYIVITTRSSWLNSALRDDEAVYWVSIGHYKAVAVGN